MGNQCARQNFLQGMAMGHGNYRIVGYIEREREGERKFNRKNFKL